MLVTQGSYTPWIHLADNSRRAAGWAIHHRVLPHYLLVVSYEGSELLIIDSKTIEIPRNGAYLIQPGAMAQLMTSPEGNRPAWLHFDVQFDARRGEQRDSASFESSLEGRAHLLQPPSEAVWGVPLPVLVPADLTPHFAQKLDLLAERYKTGDTDDLLEANHELNGLLLLWVRHERPQRTTVPAQTSMETRVARAEATMRQRLSEGIGVENFAFIAGMSRTHFTKVYTELRGVSPGRALREMRIDAAETLLRSTNLPIAEVSKLVGCPALSVLSRWFRQRHGTTPLLWRGTAAK